MKLFLLKIIIKINNFICNLFSVDDMRNGQTSNRYATNTLTPATFFKEKAHLYHYNKNYKPQWIDIFENGFTIPEVYYVQFNKCYLIGRGLLLNANKRIFLESAFFQREYLNKLRVGHLLIKNIFSSPKKELNNIIPLMNRLSNNYFHWTAESLTRIALLIKYAPGFKDKYTIVINADAPVFVTDSLQYIIGWPFDKIIRTGKNDVAKVENCIMISYPALRDKSTSMYYAYPSSVFTTLNHFAFQNIGSKNEQSLTHFIVSRANANGRNLINENQVLNRLSMMPLTTVHLEKMSFLEQVKLFQHAKLIIAPHGAGLTNLVYCNKDAVVIELFPIGRGINQTSMYYQISKAIGLRYHILMVKPENAKEDMIADDALITEIENICIDYKLMEPDSKKIKETLSS